MPVFMRLLMGPCDLLDKYAELGDLSALDCLLNITWNCFSAIAHQYPLFFQQREGIDACVRK